MDADRWIRDFSPLTKFPYLPDMKWLLSFTITCLLHTVSISAQSNCDTIYAYSELLPQYKEGEQDQFNYIMDEIAPIVGNCIKRDSQVIASLRTIFSINSSGQVIDVEFQQQALSEQCRKELTSKFLTMKGWKPGQMNGIPVCAKAYWPISCLNWQ